MRQTLQSHNQRLKRSRSRRTVVVEAKRRQVQLSEQAPASSLPGMRSFARSRRLCTLDEASAYSRCHGDRSEAILVVRAAEPKPPQPYP